MSRAVRELKMLKILYMPLMSVYWFLFVEMIGCRLNKQVIVLDKKCLRKITAIFFFNLMVTYLFYLYDPW
jgi:hypothetical protein